jgi:hypothetical protein
MTGFRAARWVWQSTLALQIFALALTVFLTLGLSVRSVARAQAPQQNALARTLFEEGVALADSGDYVGAADRFSRAYSLKPTSGIAFNWASVLIETGKLVHAEDLLLSVLRDPGADASLKSECEAVLRTLTPRIARLRVRVSGEVGEQVRVEVDGADWPRAAWDIASPIDPGAHALSLKRGGVELSRSETQLAESESRDVSLVVLPEAPASVAPLAAPTQPVADRPARAPLYKSWILWTAVGAVVVGATVAAVVLATKKDATDEPPVHGNATPGVLRW